MLLVVVGRGQICQKLTKMLSLEGGATQAGKMTTPGPS